MRLPGTAAVVGLGLMGGSLARALAARGVAVLGHDPDERAVQGALRAGVLRAALPASLQGVEEAELVVLAVPVSAAAGVLERLRSALRADAVVTDLGSTKRAVEAAARRLGVAARFVGSHPLAGDHRSGWEASREGLFAGSRVFVCPAPETDPEAVRRVCALWEGVGARPETIGAEEHDRQLALTSHLPQLASTALALVLEEAGRRRGELGPGGRDVTRLAASSPEMWGAICADNADLLDGALRALEERLAALRGALRGEGGELRDLLARGQRWATEEQGDG